MKESYNAEAVTAALKNAAAKIDATCTEFNNQRERVSAQLNSSGSAMGGALGQAANAAFESENVAAFDNLKKNINSFMSRCEQIAKNTASTEDATAATYSQQV